MKQSIFIAAAFLMLSMVSAKKISFYDFKMKTLDGKEFDFSTLKGKKVLLVNVASQCGYTPQYAELQKLSEQYKDKLVVLGFPSNSFFQEQKDSEEIATFCKKNYGVTFQMMEKIDVKGNGQHPLYKWLSSKDMNGWNDKAPAWNFNKYLVNEKGELIKYYGSGTKPLSPEITDQI
ncbi:MAG: glutathione peroxidase [Opitutaceae bacterium]|nr:glutathione peroxidase [Cytophagales bacterium]